MVRKITNYVTIALCIGCFLSAMFIHTPWALIVFPLSIVGILVIHSHVIAFMDLKEIEKKDDSGGE